MMSAPPLLRLIGNYAVGSWSSWHLLRDLNEGVSLTRIAETVVAQDRARTRKTYGARHPEAAPLRARRDG